MDGQWIFTHHSLLYFIQSFGISEVAIDFTFLQDVLSSWTEIPLQVYFLNVSILETPMLESLK